MRKLNTLINLVIKILILVSIKALVLTIESIVMLCDPKTFMMGHSNSNLILTTIVEVINSSSTQVLIWLVAMRFYSSSIPIKIIELGMKSSQLRTFSPLSTPALLKSSKLWLQDS